MKFKVGDKVKCMDTSNSYLEYGKVCTVKGITKTGIDLTECNDYRFPPQALELYTEKKKIQKDKKYRTVVGNYPARVICTDKIGEQPCIVLYKHLSEEVVMSLTAHGENCYGIKTIEEVPEVDWSKVKTDTPIWVKDGSGYVPRHFAEFKCNSVYFYTYGGSSHTSKGTVCVVKDFAVLTNPNETT